MTTKDGGSIFALLRRHRGRANAILSTQIALELGWPETGERKVRELIAEQWRQWPELVCSAPGNSGGFFIPEDYDEVLEAERLLYLARCNARIKHDSFRKRAAQLGFAMPQREPEGLVC